MSKPPMVRKPADARELLEIIDLSDIRYFEISARRAEKGADRPLEPRTNLVLMEQHDKNRLIARFRMTVTASDADLSVDLAAQYRLTEPAELTQPVIAEFIEKVATMAAYPYLREAIATSATRLGVNVPTLGLMKQGKFSVKPIRDPDADDEASDGEPEIP